MKTKCFGVTVYANGVKSIDITVLFIMVVFWDNC